MKRHDDDIDFMTEVHAATRRSAGRFAVMLSVISALFIVLFLIWAANAVLDEVTRGEGQVIPSSRTQTIQNLEGGILSEIFVKEGDIVEQGDLLLRIDNSMARSTVKEERTRFNNLRARAIRLEAETKGQTPSFGKELQDEVPDTISSEMSQYRLNNDRLNAERSVLNSRISQRRQEVEELRSRQNQLQSSLSGLNEELRMTEPLVAQGFVPQLDLVRLRRQISDVEGEIRTIMVSIPRAQNAVREAEQQVQELSANRRAEASRELNDARRELDSLREAMTAGEDRFRRTEVRAPMRGTVKQFYITTKGGVIQPGEPILDIVPLDDTLMVEAKIRPADIAFIRPDQKAIVKITAYDFSVYGGLEGTVERIGADTVTDEQGNSFYRVQLRTKEPALVHRGQSLPIIPGMTVTVDILTGRKSVLAYLMKPVLKAKHSALRER